MNDGYNNLPKNGPQQQYKVIEDAEFVDVTQSLLNERQASQHQAVQTQTGGGPVPDKVLRASLCRTASSVSGAVC